jgi:hypothetical protein
MAEFNHVRRKLAIASWAAPREGNIYGKLTIDATEALAYVEWLRQKTGEKITLTHLVGKAVAMALAEAPGLNGVIRFGRFVPHPTVDVAYLVALEEGKNLAKAKVTEADRKSVLDIAKELRALAEKLHSGKDEQFKKSMGPLSWMPSWLIRPIVYTTGFLASVLGWSIPPLGVESRPFGGAIITNVGVFGLDEGFAPPDAVGPRAHVRAGGRGARAARGGGRPAGGAPAPRDLRHHRPPLHGRRAGRQARQGGAPRAREPVVARGARGSSGGGRLRSADPQTPREGRRRDRDAPVRKNLVVVG